MKLLSQLVTAIETRRYRGINVARFDRFLLKGLGSYQSRVRRSLKMHQISGFGAAVEPGSKYSSILENSYAAALFPLSDK